MDESFRQAMERARLDYPLVPPHTQEERAEYRREMAARHDNPWQRWLFIAVIPAFAGLGAGTAIWWGNRTAAGCLIAALAVAAVASVLAIPGVLVVKWLFQRRIARDATAREAAMLAHFDAYIESHGLPPYKD